MYEYLDKNRERILEEFRELLSIASIGTDSTYDGETQRAAEWVRDHMLRIGMPRAELIPTQGKPIVYGEYLLGAGEDKPTLLIYGHYDVQPPDPVEQWITPAFEPTIRDGYIYARGANDNKGQFFAHLKALEYLLKERGGLPVNVKFVVEGEEESAGDSLAKWLLSRKDSLKCDAALISDSEAPSEDVPAIDYGLRGIAYFEVKAYGAKQDLHSGMFGGGVANPANALCHLISRVHDPLTGEVFIPGFYDDVVPISEEERSLLAEVSYNEDELKQQAGVTESWGDSRYSLRERLVARPTVDIHGISSGFTGDGVKTIIPSFAKVKISFRLVGNQRPERIQELFGNFVNAFRVPGIRFEVRNLGTSPAILIPRDNLFIKVAQRAIEEVWGRKPVFNRMGGSIPVVATIWNDLGILPIGIGYGLPDDQLHSPNERMKLSMFWKGIKTTHTLLRMLGEK